MAGPTCRPLVPHSSRASSTTWLPSWKHANACSVRKVKRLTALHPLHPDRNESAQRKEFLASNEGVTHASTNRSGSSSRSANSGNVLPTSVSLLVEFFAGRTFSHPHLTNFRFHLAARL